MEFRVDPTPLSRRRSRRILAATAAIVVGLAVVIEAFAVADRPPSGTATAIAEPTTTPATTTSPTVLPLTPTPVIAPTGPAPRVVCHAVAAGPCTAIATAALGAAVDPSLAWPSEIDVWSSLLCGSVFDCPPDRLSGRRPAGSAVVVAGTIGLWVNVLEPAAGNGPAPSDAWVIRSGPIG